MLPIYTDPGCHKSCFMLITLAYAQLMKATVKILLGKHVSSPSSRYEVCSHWCRITIPQGLRIKFAVINTPTEAPILFRCKQHRGSIQASTTADNTCLLQNCNPSIQFWQVLWRNRVRATRNWSSSLYLRDVKIPLSVWC